MASQQGTVDFIVEQMAEAGAITARKMFGEYGIYCDGKMVALVCNDTLYVKPTVGGQAFANDLELAPPYNGAKPCLVVPGDLWDDADWLAHLIAVSAAELPEPKRHGGKGKRRTG